jgi:hypothetical protein
MQPLPMATRLLIALALAAMWTSCGRPLPAQERIAHERIDWIRVSEKAAFQPRDSCGELTLGGKLWLMGGWFTSFTDPPRDVWSSPDGKEWTLVTNQAPWKHGDLPMTLAFKDRMWFMGGWHGGRLDGASASAEVWSSIDGKEWIQSTAEAGWSPRIASGCVEFDGKMWILGGIERYYDGTDAALKNDVWCSADGKSWECVTPAAEWSPRAYHQALAYGGKLWVFGGGNYVPKYSATNDVWSSSDGKTWTKVTAEAAWSPRLWFTSVVYRDRMWVLGGWSNNPSKNWGDVWHSADGANWRKLETPTRWKERHEQSVWVFQDKLWLAAGHAQPLSNEVWSLQLPADWDGGK